MPANMLENPGMKATVDPQPPQPLLCCGGLHKSFWPLWRGLPITPSEQNFMHFMHFVHCLLRFQAHGLKKAQQSLRSGKADSLFLLHNRWPLRSQRLVPANTAYRAQLYVKDRPRCHTTPRSNALLALFRVRGTTSAVESRSGAEISVVTLPPNRRRPTTNQEAYARFSSSGLFRGGE